MSVWFVKKLELAWVSAVWLDSRIKLYFTTILTVIIPIKKCYRLCYTNLFCFQYWQQNVLGMWYLWEQWPYWMIEELFVVLLPLFVIFWSLVRLKNQGVNYILKNYCPHFFQAIFCCLYIDTLSFSSLGVLLNIIREFVIHTYYEV